VVEHIGPTESHASTRAHHQRASRSFKVLQPVSLEFALVVVREALDILTGGQPARYLALERGLVKQVGGIHREVDAHHQQHQRQEPGQLEKKALDHQN